MFKSLLILMTVFYVLPSAFGAEVGLAGPLDEGGIVPGSEEPGIVPPVGGQDRFSKIEDMYAKGAQPSFSDLQGWWAGRCFYHNDHNTPWGGLLVTAESSTAAPLPPPGSEGGPLFPGTPPSIPENRFAVGLYVSQRSADHFDELREETVGTIMDLLRNAWSSMGWARVEATDGSVATKYFTDWDWRVKKAPGYLVGKSVVFGESAARYNLPSGGTYLACYYFKRVRSDSARP